MHPWDPPNLATNLHTLAQLAVAPVGTKLGEADQARYTLDEPGRGQGFRRFFTKSILIDAKYRIPLKRLFAAAMTAYQQGTLALGPIQGAFQGILKLEQTYKTDNQAHRDKLHQIRTEIVQIMNDGMLPFLDIVPGVDTNIDLLTSPRFRDTYAVIRSGIFEKYTPDKDVGKEHVEPAHTFEQVFGKAHDTSVSYLPKRTVPYTRGSSGVCEMYYVDSSLKLLLGDSVKGSVDLSPPGRGQYLVHNIKQLYEALGKDTGMLFTVSQLCTQACLHGVLSDALGHASLMTKKANQITPLLRTEGRRLSATVINPEYCLVTPRLHGATITSKMNADLNVFCMFPEVGEMAPSLAAKGVSKLNGIFTVDLQRKGHAIEMDITQARLRFKTNAI